MLVYWLDVSHEHKKCVGSATHHRHICLLLTQRHLLLPAVHVCVCVCVCVRMEVELDLGNSRQWTKDLIAFWY
jgi:hypothetical protein